MKRERGPGSPLDDSRGGAEDARGGLRQRVTTSHSRKTLRPSENVASCGGPEPRDGKRGAGSRRG